MLARGQLRIEQPGDAESSTEEEVAEALAAWGLVAEEALELEEDFALWPDCVETFNLWRKVQTQWRAGGMGGATGLDYAGVQVVMNVHRIPKKRQADLLDLLQVMEIATLAEWAKKK